MKKVPPLLVALSACLALFLVILDNTIVNVAIVPIARALGADVHSVQWVVGAYFLAQAAVIPVAGYLGVRFGVKRVFLLAFALFVVSSGLCGLARTELALIGFRVLQGLGGGALYPLAQAIAFGAYAGKDRIKGVSLTMIPGVLAPTLGPLSGGWLTLTFGWSSIFFVNVPLGLIFLGLCWRLLPSEEPRPEEQAPRFDIAGLVTCVVGVLALTYGFSLVGAPEHGSWDSRSPQGKPLGWTDPLTLSCLAAGVLTLVTFVVHALRRSDPVLDLRLFLRRKFAVATAIASINNGIFFGSMLVLPFFLTHVRSPELSSLEVGWLLMPQGIGSALMLVTVARFRRHLHVAPLLVLGTVLLSLSSWGIASVSAEPGIAPFIPWIFLRGMGFGTVFQVTQGLVVEGLAGPQLPRATSLFSVIRQISSSVGLALMLSLFGRWSAAHAATLRRSVPHPEAMGALVQRAGEVAFSDLFHVLSGLSLLGIFLVPLLLEPAGKAIRTEQGSASVPAPRTTS